jgi:hypothetical protein
LTRGCGQNRAPGRRRTPGSTRGAQEQHKRNTRGTQQRNTPSPGLHQACASLEGGFGVALGDFAPPFFILHSSFCIRPGVPLGGFARLFRIPYSAFSNLHSPRGCFVRLFEVRSSMFLLRLSKPAHEACRSGSCEQAHRQRANP